MRPMKTMKVVVNNATAKQTLQMISENEFNWDEHWLVEVYNVDNTGFAKARDANKILHDYSARELPFILLVDEKGEPYRAEYSEVGPITAERINKR